MSNNFNLKEEMKEIIKSHGGKQFFNELNAARIPFFFAAAVENTEEDTKYLCEVITPNSIGRLLTNDKFADFLNILNNGFVTVPSFEAASMSIQGLKTAQETERKPFYDGETLRQFAKGEGIEIENNDSLDDSVVQYVIRDYREKEAAKPKPESIPELICHGEALDITWGAAEAKNKTYTEEFSKFDERHREILKGDGSFLLEKEREAVYYNIGQHLQTGKDDPEEKKGDSAEKTEGIVETGDTGKQNQEA